jgi:threonine dehydrogenase-like Zn-dependent dehydrogenase
MRAIRIVDGQPELQDIDAPSGDGVVITVATSSICGSDIHLLEAGLADGMILGHEFCGTTPDGTAVAVEPMASCGACPSCLSGYLGTCASGARFYGIGLDGGMAEQVLVPADALVALPTGLPLRAGSLVEPLAVAHHGIERARITDQDRVAVIGAGPIGLATVALLAQQGITADISARHPHQQRAAETLGGRVGVEDAYDVVIDAVATSESLATAVSHLRPRGRIGLVGTIWGGTELGIGACMKEAEIIPAMTYRCRVPGRDFEHAARALVEQPEITDALISHRFPLDGCAEAFFTARNRAAGAIKVAFEA